MKTSSLNTRARTMIFARKLWAEMLLTISPALYRFRRMMSALGIVTAPEGRELAKVIPIAPYLNRRPAGLRGEKRAQVRIIAMPRAQNKR